MNLRIYKKKAKRAREILIRDYGVSAADFYFVRGGDEIGYEIFGDHDSPNPRPGTPLFYQGLDYWGEDTGLRCPIEILEDCIFWQNFKPPKNAIEVQFEWVSN